MHAHARQGGSRAIAGKTDHITEYVPAVARHVAYRIDFVGNAPLQVVGLLADRALDITARHCIAQGARDGGLGLWSGGAFFAMPAV